MMMKNLMSIVVLGAAATALWGCSGIRVVKASKSGGEIALIGDREGAMEKAREEMARTCGGPNNYEVIEEGEAVIGEVTSGEAHRNLLGGVSGTSETTQKTEWRVKYACKGAAPAAPPANDAPATTSGQPAGEIRTLRIPL
jgi:hypothetical protein